MHLEMLVDEHGKIGSDQDSGVYGYGCVIAAAGPELAQLEAAVAAEFPNGFHLKNVRRPHKRKAMQRLLALAPQAPPLLFAAAHVQGPDYGSEKYYSALAGKLDDAAIPGEGVLRAIASAPVGENGLVDPTDVGPESKNVSRLLATYSHVLRLPIVSLIGVYRARLDVRVRLGEVGKSGHFAGQLRLLVPSLVDGLRRSFARFVEEGVIVAAPSITIEVIKATDTSLFAFADAFAAVAFHYHRFTGNPSHALGRELYDDALPILSRLPTRPPMLAHGITTMGLR